jgi:hypothetical protein
VEGGSRGGNARRHPAPAQEEGGRAPAWNPPPPSAPRGCRCRLAPASGGRTSLPGAFLSLGSGRVVAATRGVVNTCLQG